MAHGQLAQRDELVRHAVLGFAGQTARLQLRFQSGSVWRVLARNVVVLNGGNGIVGPILGLALCMD